MRGNFNTESHYFVPLRPVHGYGFVAFTSSSDEPNLVECELQPYEFSGFDYKVYAVPVHPADKLRFGKERYYSCDFESLIRSGHIIEKTSPTMHIEMLRGIEPIPGTCAYLYHEGEIIVE